MLERKAPHRWFSRFLVVVAVIACASSAIAGEPNGWRWFRPLPRLGPPTADECLGVPNCVTRRSDVTRVPAGQALTISVDCGAERPYAWHWEPWQHAHVQSSLQQRTPTQLTVLARNLASIDGTVGILVGCSTEPFDEVRAAAQRPLPAKTRHRPLLGWPDPGGSVCDAWDGSGASSPAVPDCIPVVQPPQVFGFWASHVITYPCPQSHPFFAPPHYTWDNSCFSCVNWTVWSDNDPPTALKLQCTNWCTESTVQVTSACSQRPFNVCANAVTLTSDPRCGPAINTITHCTNSGVPICFITWNEQCTQGQYAGYTFSCTADNGFLFCDGCKSQ
jgi:hypothetical protein